MSIIRCKRLGQNEQIAQKVRSIIHKEEKVKIKTRVELKMKREKYKRKEKNQKLERKEAETEAFNSEISWNSQNLKSNFREFQLISEGVASAFAVYSLERETKVFFTFVPRSLIIMFKICLHG